MSGGFTICLRNIPAFSYIMGSMETGNGRKNSAHRERRRDVLRRWFYGSLADGVVAFHVLWTLLVFGGAVAMIVFPSYAFMEILVLSVTLLASLPLRFTCPVTLVEAKLRRRLDPSYDNQGSFMVTYVNKLAGTRFSRRTMDTLIGILYMLVYIYGVLMLIYR